MSNKMGEITIEVSEEDWDVAKGHECQPTMCVISQAIRRDQRFTGLRPNVKGSYDDFIKIGKKRYAPAKSEDRDLVVDIIQRFDNKYTSLGKITGKITLKEVN